MKFRDLFQELEKKTLDEIVYNPVLMKGCIDSEQHLLDIIQNVKDAQPLLKDLELLGINVFHPARLSESKMEYKSAIPTLLYWLNKIPNYNIQTSVLSCLHVSYAFHSAWRPLVGLFQTLEGMVERTRWKIGYTLYELANDKVYEDVVKLAVEESYGTDRAMIIRALGKMKKHPEVIDVLIQILDQETGIIPALEALGKLKAVKARNQIEKFIFNQNVDIRREAKNALAKIDHFIEKSKPGYVKKTAAKNTPYIPLKKRVWQKLDPNIENHSDDISNMA